MFLGDLTLLSEAPLWTLYVNKGEKIFVSLAFKIGLNSVSLRNFNAFNLSWKFFVNFQKILFCWKQKAICRMLKFTIFAKN